MRDDFASTTHTYTGYGKIHSMQKTFLSVRDTRGFTIVELLIVIVVIAILAAITIVAYNGIQNRAHDSAVQTDLRQLGQSMSRYYVENNDTFPAMSASGAGSFQKVSKNSYGNHYTYQGNEYNLLFCYNTSTGVFAYIANSKSGKVFSYSNGSVKESPFVIGTSTSTCTSSAGFNIAGASAYWYYGQSGANTWVWI